MLTEASYSAERPRSGVQVVKAGRRFASVAAAPSAKASVTRHKGLLRSEKVRDHVYALTGRRDARAHQI
jgi:hypothetical protein